MKRHINSIGILTIGIVIASLLSGCHKDVQLEVKEPKVTEQPVFPQTTSATFRWEVDYLGVYEPSVLISLKQDMSDAVSYGFDERYWQTSTLLLTVDNLEKGTTYYYCYQVVNPALEYNTEVKSFTTAATSSYPTGAINGIFSVSPSTIVYFSQGNLQYRASNKQWRFAEHQYDYIGSNNSYISSSYSNFIDLFGWGTSGWNSGAVCYQPWSTSSTQSSYYPGGSSTNNLTGRYANADWGVYNAINNGGNTAGQWRTLTKDEWVYVFKERKNASSKYGHGKVNDVCGMILLPDIWTLPSGLSFKAGNSSWANNYTVEQWAQMEANGAVFFPAAGHRADIPVPAGPYSSGNYWSASYYDKSHAYDMSFYSDHFSPSSNYYRSYGESVRLVTPAE